MTYNPALDWAFSSLWKGLELLGVYLLVIYFIRRWVFPKSEKAWKSAMLYFVIPFLWIMFIGEVEPRAMGYGKAVGIVKIQLFEGRLFVKDYIKTSGSKTTWGEKIYRLHMIDPKTGKKMVRFNLNGSGHVIGIKHDSLVLSYPNAVVFFSATRGNILLIWDAETLPRLFPQIHAGINDLSVSDNEINATALDGNRWTLNIADGHLRPYTGDNRDRHETQKGEDPNEHRTGKHNRPSQEKRVALCHKAENEHQYFLCGHKDSARNNELFLDGKIIASSVKNGCFIIMHYETITKLKAIFTCMSLDGRKKIWEVKQSLLSTENNKEPLDIIHFMDEDDSVFLVAIENEIIALQLKDGAVLWREVP